MAFGLSAGAIAGIASAGIGLASANAQSNAAQASEQHQTQMAVYSAINQQANLNNTLALLRPYVDAGTTAVGQQRDLLGLNGNEAQQGVINGIQNSPLFQDQILERGVLQRHRCIVLRRCVRVLGEFAHVSRHLRALLLRKRKLLLLQLIVADCSASLIPRER